MNGEDPFLVVDLRLRYAVCQACCYRKQRGQEPQPPPEGTLLSPHKLVPAETAVAVERARDAAAARALVELKAAVGAAALLDRKSTRLNSSHVSISYAVFCSKVKDL